MIIPKSYFKNNFFLETKNAFSPIRKLLVTDLMGNVPLVVKYNKTTKLQETKMKYLKFPI